MSNEWRHHRGDNPRIVQTNILTYMSILLIHRYKHNQLKLWISLPLSASAHPGIVENEVAFQQHEDRLREWLNDIEYVHPVARGRYMDAKLETIVDHTPNAEHWNTLYDTVN